MKSAAPTPPDVRSSVRRELAARVQEWIRGLERDATALHLRGNHVFAAQCTAMAREAERVLEVLTG